MNRIFLMIVAISGILSCSDHTETSPFGDIFSDKLYAPLTDSIRDEPARDDLYFRRAVLLNANNLPEPALADFLKAWSINRQEKYAYGVSSLLVDKKPDSAIQFLNTALKEIPQSIILRLSLARAYDAQNQTTRALEICDQILQINPQQVDVMVMKSDLLEKQGDDAQATTMLEQAYQITPFDIELNYNLAYKYAQNKNPRVITLCDSLAARDSLKMHAEPFYYKGIYYSNKSESAKAIAEFDEAINRDHNFKNAYIEKGKVYYDQKKYSDALKVFNLVMRVSPSFADAHFWIGKCQEIMGQKEEAKLNYQRAYELDKTFLEAKEAFEKS